MSNEPIRHYEDIPEGVQRTLGSHLVTREEIVRFALEWDPQPFHIDEAAAKTSVFGGLTASSCHTYSVSSLIFSRSPGKTATAAMMGLELQFPVAVRPGDELTLRDVCTEKRLSGSRPGHGVVSSRTTLTNQEDQDVFVMTSTYLVRCRDVSG
jgi:acyl dehydratase